MPSTRTMIRMRICRTKSTTKDLIHGTHVSGTIAGTASNTTSEHVQKGVAYEAKLYAYKVLGPEGGTSAQVIDGIEHAVEDKMDVINLSLGSDLEKDPIRPTPLR